MPGGRIGHGIEKDPMAGTRPRASTLHERLLREFRGLILSRQWPPGYQLPFETELADAHGVSRMTMNKVLTELAREGFLVRRRKQGTFVARPHAQAAVMEIADIAAEVEALGQAHRFVLRERKLRPPEPREIAEARITGDAAEPVLHLLGVHLADGQPFCREERIINPAAAPAALDQDFAAIAPGQWLLQEIPWTAAEHRIRAIGADDRVARDLGLRPGEACLEVTRRTEASGRWVTLARQTYPSDRHELLARFEPRARIG
jgi:GntR family histidine utilization transcriptional repressor